jgi:hypothetical protein
MVQAGPSLPYWKNTGSKRPGGSCLARTTNTTKKPYQTKQNQNKKPLELEDITLSKINQTHKHRYYMFSLMWKLQKKKRVDLNVE